MPTHDVTNQSPPFDQINLAKLDAGLIAALRTFAPDADRTELDTLGDLAGRQQTLTLGEDANRNPPELLTHDRFGHRIDEVRFHPAWHQLLGYATQFGLHGSPWSDPSPNAHLMRAAKFYVWSQVEAGHGCPISMTYAAMPALRLAPELSQLWEPALSSRLYDPLLAPIAAKRSALCGMAMTEKQGGSDVRANTTRAIRNGDSNEYLITGHKWFCSAPMSDAFLVLAQATAGITCFLLPRVLPDGSRNSFAIQRLKDKLGNRSNASSEIEFDNSTAYIIGEEGRGVRTIVEMVNHTRLDCMLGSSGITRMAVLSAAWHAQHRAAFGKKLIDWPLMQNVLADLALESEAATLLSMRVAHAVDNASLDPQEAALKRLGTAVGKYWICKRAPLVIGEALECLGGNGYVEESMLPRLYREAPVNSIWEGSGNVSALDLLRILHKDSSCIDAYEAELTEAQKDPRLTQQYERTIATMRSGVDESQARRVAEDCAILWQASLLLRHAPNYLADAFIASRIQRVAGRGLGTLPNSRLKEIAQRVIGDSMA